MEATFLNEILVDFHRVWKAENTAVGIRHADYVTPSTLKSWH
jgi:hypothetical protein